jgi:HAMP domain-containing protein
VRVVTALALAGQLLGAGALRADGATEAQPLEATSETGPVLAIVRLSPPAATIGDLLILELEVRAEPDVELLMPEFGESLDRFSIIDFTRSEAADDKGGTISRQRYTLAPSRSGPQLIPPLLVEFVDRRVGRDPAPEGEDAYELLTAALAFEVAAALPEGASLELREPLGRLGPREMPGRYRTLWVLAALLAIAAATIFGIRAWAIWRSRSLRRSAYEVAKADLDALLMAPRPGEREMDAFFVQLSGIVRRYLENRFGLRSPELTTEEFVEALANSPDLVRLHQRLLREFLNRADLVKFAHLVPDRADVERSLESARSFLEATRGDVRVERSGV